MLYLSIYHLLNLSCISIIQTIDTGLQYSTINVVISLLLKVVKKLGRF